MGYTFINHTPGEVLCTFGGKKSNWTFLEDAGFRQYQKTKRRIVKVQYVCGLVREVQYNNIRTGKSMSCNTGECKTVPNIGNRNTDTGYKSIFYSYKKGAAQRGYVFDLTFKQFKELLSGNCFYCGIEPSQVYQIKNPKTGEIRAGIPIIYNGIDRKENKEGYTTNNSVSCCKYCNRGKMHHDTKSFLQWVKRVYEYLNLQNE